MFCFTLVTSVGLVHTHLLAREQLLDCVSLKQERDVFYYQHVAQSVPITQIH